MVTLSTNEVVDYINDISLGRSIVEYSGKTYILKHPSQETIFKSRIVYKNTLREAIEFGLPTETALEKVIESRKLYTEEDERKIKEIEDKIKGQQAVLEKTYRVPAKRDRLVQIINRMQEEIDVIKRKKLILMERTCEAKAREEQYIYLCYTGCYEYDKDWNEVLVWKTKDEFENESDNRLRNFLLFSYISFYHGLPVSVIRAIARSNHFIIRYLSSSKTSTPIFNLPTAEYTIDMLSVTYWAGWYRSLYDMLPDEIPPDEIIGDDEALDAYMEEIMTNRRNERTLRQDGNKFLGKNRSKTPSATDHGDVIITASNPIYKDVEYNHHKKFKKDEKASSAVREKGEVNKV